MDGYAAYTGRVRFIPHTVLATYFGCTGEGSRKAIEKAFREAGIVATVTPGWVADTTLGAECTIEVKYTFPSCKWMRERDRTSEEFFKTLDGLMGHRRACTFL